MNNYEYIDPFDEKYDYLMRVEHLARYLFAANLLNNYNSVLDVACADGYGTKILSNNVIKVTGIDKNKEYINIAKSKYNNKNINYKCINVDEEVIAEKYDGIVCFETLEHLNNPNSFLNNLYNILNDNGTIVLSIPNSDYEEIIDGRIKDPFHINVFKYDEIVNLIKKTGFKIIKMYGQSYTNKIVNDELKDYILTDLYNDAKTIGYPNEDDINKTYSYIFILKK